MFQTFHSHDNGRSSKTGFTLIELLVVVAIISLLVSILIPSLSKAKELAKNVVCATNLRAIGHGMLMYADDNDEDFPPPSHGTPGLDQIHMDFPDVDNPQYNLGPIYKQEYVGELNVLKCPYEYKEWVDREDLASYVYRDYDFERPEIDPVNNISFDLSELPSEPIVADRMEGWAPYDTIQVHNFWSGGNVLYIGGHVTWWDTSDAPNPPDPPLFGPEWGAPGAWKLYGSQKPPGIVIP